MLIAYDDSVNGTYYRVRPSSIYSSASFFNFSDREVKNTSLFASVQNLIVSYPTFMKYSRIKSLKDMFYERLVIKMPYGSTIYDQVNLVKEIKVNIADPFLR